MLPLAYLLILFIFSFAMQSWKNSCELKNCKYFIFILLLEVVVLPIIFSEDRNEGFLEYRVEKGQKSFKGQR